MGLFEAANAKNNKMPEVAAAPAAASTPEVLPPQVELFEDLDVLSSPPARGDLGGIRRWKSSFDIISGKPAKKRKLHSDFAPKKQITSTIEIGTGGGVSSVATWEPQRSVTLVTVSDTQDGKLLLLLLLLLTKKKKKKKSF